jgi:hypothetical protein
MKIGNEFIPYEQALALKELGFDEPCLAKYQKLSETANYQLQLLQKERNCNRLDTAISAPLYQQVFRWLYQKLDIEKGVMPLDTESQQLLLKELLEIYKKEKGL